MVTESLTAETESTKMGQYLRKLSRRLHKSRHDKLTFDERITLTSQGWYFDRQPVVNVDQTGGCRPTTQLPDFMTYAVNEYGGIDNLLRFMDIKLEFVLSLS